MPRYTTKDLLEMAGLNLNPEGVMADCQGIELLDAVVDAALELEEDEDEDGRLRTVWGTPERIAELCLDDLTDRELWQAFVDLELYEDAVFPVGAQTREPTEVVYEMLCPPLVKLAERVQKDEEDELHAESLRQDQEANETPMGEEMGG